MVHLPTSSVARAVFASIVLLLTAGAAAAQALVVTPRQATGIYATGETAGWTIAVPAGSTALASGYPYTLKRNNATVVQSGTLDLTGGPATIETTLAEPAMLFLSINPAGGTRTLAGAAVAPTELQPSMPRPADFDAFWQAKLDLLAAVPANPVVTPGTSGRTGVDYATVRLDNVGGAHVYGQIARPSGEGKFPAILILQWAGGPYPLQKSWVTDRAAEGWLALNVEPHDVPCDESAAYYAALPATLKNYHTIGNDDRDKSYFLQMYLGDCRAVEYLASRPDWNGRVFVVTGGSMGGQQSLAVAGLRPQITHVIVNEPAGCDTNGSLHGRTAGYPFWDKNNPQVMETSRYFDPVNFASHIKAACLVSMGFVDEIAPPVGIWIAYNQITAVKEAAPMITAPHNDVATSAQQAPYFARSSAWTNALVHGTYPQVAATPVAPTITWEPLLPVRAGTVLSSAQLNARAAMPGTFSYAPAAGTVLTAGTQTLTATFTPYDTVNFTPTSKQVALAVEAAGPAFTGSPQSAGPAAGNSATLTAAATPPAGGPAITWQWQRSGTVIAGATTSTLTLPALAPADTGLYTAVATSTTSTASEPAIVGVQAATKVLGAATEIGWDIFVAANGNTFDQVLLDGAAAAVTADYAGNQITRTSYLDGDGDIVQVEFSGPGTLAIVLDQPVDPALPAKYNQAIRYMKGHAGIVITGADERSNVSVFSVGRVTAVNQALFKDGTDYDGIADLAFIAIHTTNGRFGGVRTSNANYFAAKGFTGLYAPGVAFAGPVFIGDITAFDAAQPGLITGSVADARITGGDLQQDNRRPVRVSGINRLKFTAGADSHGNALPVQANLGVLARDGENVTSQLVPVL